MTTWIRFPKALSCMFMRKCRMPLAVMAAAGLAGSVAIAAGTVATVTVSTDKTPYEITEGGTNPVRKVELQQIVLENEYVRAVILPEFGGRIAQVYDKVAKADMFLKEYPPIVWQPAMRYSAYNSQLGGIIVNFPYFHHGNSFADNWNWQVDREADGTAVVVLGWTDQHLQQRVVQRITLRPGHSLLSSVCRYLNLNPYSTGFAPWVNTLFPYNDDLQWIVPTQYVVPHGFNADNLSVLPWSWPDFDESSLCYWRNMKGSNEAPYISTFALQLERDFSGVYYHKLDRGTARLFDRREQPGLKLWHIPPGQHPPLLSSRSGFELWSSPALIHEDPIWWEGYAVRECHDAWMPVHGSGGFREANAHGAVNLTRGADYVEVGVCLAHRVPGAVVSLVALDGTWWRQVADLGPDQPLRHRLPRAPGRSPLELRVTDADGQLLINCDDRPDPGLRITPRFSGKPISQAEGNGLLRSEQYHPLWRGPTGDKQPFSAVAAGAYRAAFAADPKNVSARLGLARTLMVDAQLRSPDRPATMAPEQVPGFQKNRLTEAVAALQPVLDNPEAAILAGEAHWRLGNAKAAADCFTRGGDDAVAQLGLARALAELGRTKEAAVAAATAAKGLPRIPPALQVMAGIAILRGQYAEAVGTLERLLAQDPVDALTLTLLAKAQRGAGKEQLAVAAERRAAELQSQTREPVDLAVALQRLGLSAAGNAAGPDGRSGEGAERYYRWLMSCVDGVEKELPRIIEAAEAAARIHVNGGRIGVDGDLSFVYEAFGRSGGLMSLATIGSWSVQITGLVDANNYRGIGPAQNKAGDNILVIGFGSQSVLERALAGGAPFDFTIDSHAAEHNGLVPAGNSNWVVPTAQNANIVALWVWTGEFAAACTRLGKMPLMFQGFGAGGAERARRLGCPEVLTGSGFGSGRQFHPEKPEPVKAGFAGKEYLRELRAILGRIHTDEMDNIRRVAATAAAAEAKGRVFCLISGTHASVGNQNRPCKLPGVRFDLKQFQPGDAVFYVGFNYPDNDLADSARKAGATFMASYSTYEKGRDRPARPVAGMNPGELFVDQHWPFGDCAVQFPGYDIKILPPSGVAAEAITGMVLAELQKLRAGGNSTERQQPQ